MELIILFTILFCLLIIGMPIAFAVGLAAWSLFILKGVPLILSIQQMHSGTDSFILLAVPFFITAGLIMGTGGISKRIISFCSACIGHVRGGLGIVNVLASMIFAGISGSAVADTAAIGGILIPGMIEKGYPKRYSAAITATSATIGIVIPPSIPMVLYGVVSGTSIAALFIAGIIPGLLIGIFQMITAYTIACKYNYPTEGSFSFNNLIVTTRRTFLALLLPVILIGGITSGIVTPTEAGAIAVIFGIVISLIYGTLSLKNLYKVILDSAILTAIIMIIVSTSSMFGWVLSWESIPQTIAQWVFRLNLSPNLTLLFISALFIILGTFLHANPMMLIVVPIMIPLVEYLGLDLVHFGILVVLLIGIGQQTPPVGSALYVCSAISGEDILSIAIAGLPFLFCIFLVLLITLFFPDIALFLPRLVGLL